MLQCLQKNERHSEWLVANGTSCRSCLDLFAQATWSNTNTNTYEKTNKKANTDTNAKVWKRLWVAPIAGLVWIYLPQPRDLPSCLAAISDFESQFTPQPFPFNEPQKQVNRAALTSDWNDWTQSVWVLKCGEEEYRRQVHRSQGVVFSGK